MLSRFKCWPRLSSGMLIFEEEQQISVSVCMYKRHPYADFPSWYRVRERRYALV